ncbi:MAG: hypothetical protein Q8P00_07125 [Dehalococcoidia bacterium]|nr:hypothetical protein [Dehalococcoidia bacterium]
MRKERELEKSENWDFTQSEVKQPVKASRVVVSVAFRRDEFALVSEYAERIGKKTSEFIREAAVQKAGGQGGEPLVYGSGSGGTSWWIEQMPTTTRTSGTRLEEPNKTPAMTY